MASSLHLAKRSFLSPLGDLELFAHDTALVALYWPQHARKPALVAFDGLSHPILEEACAQLAEYFAGTRRAFDLPLEPVGTPFQRSEWRALESIPYGETQSYGQLSQALRKPTAARAVGSANARNPLSIIVPCHRVVGAVGTLTGYAGGLRVKGWLLEHERACTQDSTVLKQTSPVMREPLAGAW